MRKRMSVEEMEKRSYHADVRKFKDWCDKRGTKFFTFDDNIPESICTLSTDEYSVGVRRDLLDEDNESYFLPSEEYEAWIEEHFQ